MTTIVAMPDVPPAPLADRAATADASAADRETFGALVDDSVAAMTKDDAVTRDTGAPSTEARSGSPGHDAIGGDSPTSDETEDSAATADEAAHGGTAAAAAAAVHAATAPVLAPSPGSTAGATESGASALDVVTTAAEAARPAESIAVEARAPALVPANTGASGAVPTAEVHGDAPSALAADGDAAVDGAEDAAGLDIGVGTEPMSGAGASTTDAPGAPGATTATPVPITGRADAASAPPPPDVATGPAATDPANLDPAADASPWAQVARAVRGVRHHADGSHTMTVRLDPPELGTVRIELRSHDGQLSIHAFADSPATRDTLSRALPELRAALEASGLDTGTIDVDAHGAKQHDAHGAKQHDANARDDLGPSPRAGRRGVDANVTTADGRTGAARHGETVSRLDLRL